MPEINHRQLHVAAIAFPFGSHAAQVLNITRGLAAAAPSVTFSFFSTAKSNLFLFGSTTSSGSGFDNIKVYSIDDGIPENHVFSGNPLEEIDFFYKAAPLSLRKAIDKAVSDTNIKITCLTSDAFLPTTIEIAEELGVPWVPVFAPSATSLTCHVHTDLIRQMLEGKDEELLTFVPGLESIRARDLPREICKNVDSTFGKMLHIAGLTMSRATAVAINTFEELECDVIRDLNSKLKLCLAVGPLTVVSPPSTTTVEDPYGCLPWLDGQKPASVAYVSFGTSATPPPHELFALAQGLETSGVPFLWSLKDSVKVHLPDGFSERTRERGKMVPWTPQTKILEHSALGVFVTHCGWNSVLESIMAGVPIIYRPFFGDQDMIGRLVSSVWEIGVDVGDGVFTKEGTVKALDLILCKKEGEIIKEKAAALKEQAKQAVAPKGSTSKNFKRLLEIVTAS